MDTNTNTDIAETRASASAADSAARPTPRTVAFVASYYPPHMGGVENCVARIAQALAAEPDFTPVVITTRQSGLRTSDGVEDGVRVIRLGVWTRLSNSPISPLWPFQVRRWLRRTGAELVNAHAPVPGLADVAILVSGKRRTVFTYHAGTMRKDGEIGRAHV